MTFTLISTRLNKFQLSSLIEKKCRPEEQRIYGQQPSGSVEIAVKINCVSSESLVNLQQVID